MEFPTCTLYQASNRLQANPACFFLTDFMVRHFDRLVMQGLGLDRHPQLRDMYFGHYTTLVYQAQTDDPALTAKAQECAAFLGLAFERRFTGYTGLRDALSPVGDRVTNAGNHSP